MATNKEQENYESNAPTPVVKILTVHQPWAYLICMGINTVENRTWKTDYRGRILIHSSKNFNISKLRERGGLRSILTEKQLECLNEYSPQDVLRRGRLLISAIIGSVEIIDCVKDDGIDRYYDDTWALPDHYHLILRRPVMFENPVLNVRGKLGLWNCPQKTFDEILEENSMQIKN